MMSDLFTKFVVSVPLVTGEARTVAEKFVENWVLKYGVPDVFHTDQGTNFGSTLMAGVCKLLKIDKTRKSPYHPQGNGQIERYNRVVADVLSKYCAENPRTMDTMLPYANFVYNTTVHRTTGATPFALVFEQECQYPVDLFFPKPLDEKLSQNEFVEDLDRQFREAHPNTRELLGMNQKRQNDRLLKKVYGQPYAAGDKVWLFCPHKAKSRKFVLPWEEPYVVLERMNEMNYKIAKSGQSVKWKIVHFNMLKPYLEEPPDVSQRKPTPMRSEGYFDKVEDEDELDEIERGMDNRGYMTQYPKIRRVARPHRYRRGERPRWMVDADDWLGDLFRDGDLAEAQRRRQPHGKAETPEVLEVEPGGDMGTPGNAQSTPAVTDAGQSGENQTSSRPKRNVAPPCRLGIDEIF